MIQRKVILTTIFILLCVLSSNCVFAADSIYNNTSLADSSSIQAELVNCDIPFIENEGQQNSQADYYANTLYGTAYITSDGITHVIGVNESDYVVLTEQFLDANGNTLTTNSQGVDKSNITINSYTGNDSTNWYTGVTTYNQVSLGEIYDNISVVLKATGGNVEKFFYLEPGADINDIIIEILGATSLEILDDGSLTIYTTNGTVNMSTPVGYQDDNDVNASYQILSNNTYGFTVENYDPNKTIIIDPTLTYSTYLGGSSGDCGYGIDVDEDGNIYITGFTYSSDFQVTDDAYQSTSDGYCDVFVSVFNNTGNLMYSTYLGGSNIDSGYDVAVDADGNIYITGQTYSPNFPVTSDAYQSTIAGGYVDTFVSVFNSTGNLIYSTYLGGNSYDEGCGVAVDKDGNIYITGQTYSSNFPVTSDAYQSTCSSSGAFISMFNSTGNLSYSTYLGGSYDDFGSGVAVDADGNIYITGGTSSTDFPVTNDAYQSTPGGSTDTFISVFNSSKDLSYSTYLGGNFYDVGSGVAVDAEGNFYITGGTSSTDFPVTSDAYQSTYGGGDGDAFVSVFNSTGNLTYSTYLGRNNCEGGNGVAVDADGNIYITGFTNSKDFPVTPDGYPQYNVGNDDDDAFISVFNGAGNLIYSTCLEGTNYDYGSGVAVDKDGNIYITGNTSSTDFPVTSDAYQDTNQGQSDVFVSVFSSVKKDTIITMVNVSGFKGQTVTLIATLKDQDGTPLNGETVEFLVNGVSVGTAVTDASGVATLHYTIIQDPGTYSITVSYAGNSPYNGSADSKALTVKNDGGFSGGRCVNAMKTSTVSMQDTGAPIMPFLFAILLIGAGLTSKRR